MRRRLAESRELITEHGAGPYIVGLEGDSCCHDLSGQVVGCGCDVRPLGVAQLGVGCEGLTLWGCGDEGQEGGVELGECVHHSLHAAHQISSATSSLQAQQAECAASG